jgi:hypothetical protein
MAKKRLEIDLGVNTGELDNAAAKVGELKKLTSDISIQYDIDGKPLDVVINKSLNLQKQVRALTAELRRTKEGTAEFKLLSTALGDAQDGLSRANAKSRDLLASLQLIPGPVGEFASQLNGVIGLLKTFSSFSLKDLQFQFKETVNDFKDIYKGFFGTKQAADDATASLDKNVNVLDKGTVAASKSVKANENLTGSLGNTQKAFRGLSEEQLKVVNSLDRLENTTKGFDVKMKNGTAQVSINGAAYRNLSQAELQAAASGKVLTVTTGGIIVAETAATAATLTFAGALQFLKGAFLSLAAATGIGLVIVAIGALISLLVDGFVALKDWASGTAEAARDTAKFGKEVEKLNELLDLDLADAKRRNAVRVAELKATGKSEVEIKKETVKGLQDQLKLVETAQVDVDKLENDLFKRSKKRGADITEDLKTTQKRRTELDQQAKDLRTQIRVSELEDQGNAIKLKTDADKKAAEDEYQRKLKELDALIQLEINKDATSRKLLADNLEKRAKMVIDHDKMGYYQAQLLRQENDKKTQAALDEDSKRLQAYQSKVDDIRIAAIEDEEERQLEARAKKLYDDKVALTYDTEFQKRSKEEQTAILKNLEETASMDLLKIRDGFYMKKFQKDEEAFLKEVELQTRVKEFELQNNQVRLDQANDFNTIYGDNIFGNKGLKAQWEKYFVDLRQVYADEFVKTDERLVLEKEQLQRDFDAKKLTRESYEAQILAINDKLIANRERNTQRQLDLDKLEIDSKRANADMTIQVGERLASALSAIAGKNKKLQKAAALVEAGVAIARIVTDTTRAIIAFSASVAPLGPAGVPIAAAYAVKAKISGALGIATIIAQSIGKLKSIDDSDSGGTEGGGGQQGNGLGRGYAQGGLIKGRRHAQGGTLIEAEDGEAVMTRGSVTMFAPLLSAMNQMGGGTSFSNMNVVRPDNPILNNPSQQQAPLIVKTYVVENELSSTQAKQARLKDLSTL